MKRTALIVICLLASSLTAQDPPKDYRFYFNAGIEASKSGDLPAYIQNMTKALELNTKAVNRPYYMYHLARAYALSGQKKEAAAWLNKLWEDGVESLMISYVELDKAFDEVRRTSEYAALTRKVARMTIKRTPLSGSAVLLDGAGCNLVASIGKDGILLVDSGYEKAGPAILASLREGKTEPRIRFIVNTHEHEDHVAGNALLGRKATVIAHAKAREAMLAEQPFIEGVVNIPPKSAAFLPSVLIDKEITIHFNGEDVRLIPLPVHTASDVLVYFPRSKVLHMGDNYFPGTTDVIYPGEDLPLFFQTMDGLLRDLPDEVKVVTGHAGVVSGKELKENVALARSIHDFVSEGVKSGKTLEALQSEAEKKLYPARWVRFYFGKLSGE